MKYNTIKKYYDKGFYTDEQMKTFVEAKWITGDQYKGITTIDYVA